MRRGRRTTGRIVASTLGFGLAYYFDAVNGAHRRQRLQGMAQRALRAADRVTPDVTDPPPVFHPLLGTHRPGVDDRRSERPAAVR